MTNLPILKVSASSLKTYQQCARKYYFTYINKQPRKTWDHLDLGNFVHGVLEEFHNKLQADLLPQDKWGDVLTAACKVELKKYKLTPEHSIKAKEMLKVYLEVLRTDGMPSVLFNEKSFNIKLNEGLVVRGFIDRVDKDPDRGYHIVDYKGLDINTPIPTPSGWTTMGELKVGDFVFGSDGKAVEVTIKSETHNRPCYKITLSDGSTVICDNVHQWGVAFKSNDGISNYDNIVLSAKELFLRFNEAAADGSGNFIIYNSNPLQLQDKELPMAPWALGASIADRDDGIPDIYLRGSFNQRFAVLHGLMSTKGFCDSNSDMGLFTTNNKNTFKSVNELIRTFGVTAHCTEIANKQGVISYSIGFLHMGINHFILPHMSELVDLRTLCDESEFNGLACRRTIVNIKNVESVPTQCISVDSPDSLYLCGEGMIATHNTGRSKYLDDFQLLIYGIYLLNEHPELERFKASYLVLSEKSKMMSYTFTQTDVRRVISKIQNIASQIREDKTWEPKPQFLCSYCDFEEICPVTLREQQFKQTRGDWK